MGAWLTIIRGLIAIIGWRLAVASPVASALIDAVESLMATSTRAQCVQVMEPESSQGGSA